MPKTRWEDPRVQKYLIEVAKEKDAGILPTVEISGKIFNTHQKEQLINKLLEGIVNQAEWNESKNIYRQQKAIALELKKQRLEQETKEKAARKINNTSNSHRKIRTNEHRDEAIGREVSKSNQMGILREAQAIINSSGETETVCSKSGKTYHNKQQCTVQIGQQKNTGEKTSFPTIIITKKHAQLVKQYNILGLPSGMGW